MAHRGRLNTLTGVMGKPYHQLISEFKGTPGMPEGVTKSGDVKYHMGYASTREIAGNKIDLSLAFNPSHLEAVNVVAAGRIRALRWGCDRRPYRRDERAAFDERQGYAKARRIGGPPSPYHPAQHFGDAARQEGRS